MKQKTRIICHALIKNKENILLLKRKSDEVDNSGLWEIPGGALEFGEHPEETAKREIKEETGLNVESLKLIYLMSYTYEKPDKKVHLLRFFYSCNSNKSKIEIDDNEHDDYTWIKKEEVVNFQFPEYLEKIWKELINNEKER